MVFISNNLTLPDTEIEISPIRASGPGGQNVNKVSTAVHLRFDIRASSLPDHYKERLLRLHDTRISSDGVIVIKAREYRTFEKNREAALGRLQSLIRGVAVAHKTRKPTRPSRSSQRKRVDSKVKRGRLKALRGRVRE